MKLFVKSRLRRKAEKMLADQLAEQVMLLGYNSNVRQSIIPDTPKQKLRRDIHHCGIRIELLKELLK